MRDSGSRNRVDGFGSYIERLSAAGDNPAEVLRIGLEMLEHAADWAAAEDDDALALQYATIALHAQNLRSNATVELLLKSLAQRIEAATDRGVDDVAEHVAVVRACVDRIESIVERHEKWNHDALEAIVVRIERLEGEAG